MKNLTYNKRMKNLEKIKFKAGRLVLKMIYFTYISNILKANIMELPIHIHVPENSKLDSFPISEHRALQLSEDKYCLKPALLEAFYSIKLTLWLLHPRSDGANKVLGSHVHLP